MQLFSVIIPSYNRCNSLIEALDSVKSQTYRPIEIVVVDDGSTDNTARAVKEWSLLNKEQDLFDVRYFYQVNAGASAARNKGISEIRGKYVQFLDSDDLLYPDRFVRTVNKIETRNADFVYTGYECFDSLSGETTAQIYGYPEGNLLELALRGELLAIPLRCVFLSDLINRIGCWDTGMVCGEDREYIERAICLAYKPVAIQEILGRLRRGAADHLSSIRNTFEGQVARVRCETLLVERTINRNDLSSQAKHALISRVARIGCRLNAKGWSEPGNHCLNTALVHREYLSVLDRIRLAVCRSSKIGGWLYIGWVNTKRSISRHRS